MLKNMMMTLLLVSLSLGCVCGKIEKENGREKPQNLSPELAAQVAAPNNALAFELLRLADKPGKNLFFSPYSLSSALSMTYTGARGETAEQMAEALNFDLFEGDQHEAYQALQQSLNAIAESGEAQLSVANALFGADKISHRIKTDFVTTLRKRYESDIYSLNFKDFNGTAKFINNWVKQKTENHIRELVTPDHIEQSHEGLVLVNAIHFKGGWQEKFYPRRTKEDTFWTSSTLRSPEYQRTVQMMNNNGKYRLGTAPGLQVLELPYSHKDLSMLIFLPDEMETFVKNLNNENLRKWTDSMWTEDVNLQIPKFKLELELSDVPKKLESLGMIDAFEPVAANFSGIIQPEAEELIFIYDIIHKAFVEVNEEGTEAAAATAVIIGRETLSALPVEPILFRADKPFVFMIMHNPSNTVLFLGKMNDPD
ncbi:MAG: serpin family protein [Candidatus Cloacimonetes bacterium]|nr:serpin family protein [Candidatus Cloacimonadota bacterium]